MRIKRPVIKRSCDCDDWDDDLIWFDQGSSWDLGHDAPAKPRSVSRSAFEALNYRPRPTIGFHKPRGNR
jgi:hypothetical protein